MVPPPPKPVKNPLFSSAVANLPLEDYTQGIVLVPPPKDNEKNLPGGLAGEEDSFLGQDERLPDAVPFLVAGGSEDLSLSGPLLVPPDPQPSRLSSHSPPSASPLIQSISNPPPSSSPLSDNFNQIPLDNTVPLYNPNEFSAPVPSKRHHPHFPVPPPSLPVSSKPPLNPAVSSLSKNIATCTPALVIDSAIPVSPGHSRHSSSSSVHSINSFSNVPISNRESPFRTIDPPVESNFLSRSVTAPQLGLYQPLVQSAQSSLSQFSLDSQSNIFLSSTLAENANNEALNSEPYTAQTTDSTSPVQKSWFSRVAEVLAPTPKQLVSENPNTLPPQSNASTSNTQALNFPEQASVLPANFSGPSLNLTSIPGNQVTLHSVPPTATASGITPQGSINPSIQHPNIPIPSLQSSALPHNPPPPKALNPPPTAISGPSENQPSRPPISSGHRSSQNPFASKKPLSNQRVSYQSQFLISSSSPLPVSLAPNEGSVNTVPNIYNPSFPGNPVNTPSFPTQPFIPTSSVNSNSLAAPDRELSVQSSDSISHLETSSTSFITSSVPAPFSVSLASPDPISSSSLGLENSSSTVHLDNSHPSSVPQSSLNFGTASVTDSIQAPVCATSSVNPSNSFSLPPFPVNSSTRTDQESNLTQPQTFSVLPVPVTPSGEQDTTPIQSLPIGPQESVSNQPIFQADLPDGIPISIAQSSDHPHDLTVTTHHQLDPVALTAPPVTTPKKGTQESLSSVPQSLGNLSTYPLTPPAKTFGLVPLLPEKSLPPQTVTSLVPNSEEVNLQLLAKENNTHPQFTVNPSDPQLNRPLASQPIQHSFTSLGDHSLSLKSPATEISAPALGENLHPVLPPTETETQVSPITFFNPSSFPPSVNSNVSFPNSFPNHTKDSYKDPGVPPPLNQELTSSSIPGKPKDLGSLPPPPLYGFKTSSNVLNKKSSTSNAENLLNLGPQNPSTFFSPNNISTGSSAFTPVAPSFPSAQNKVPPATVSVTPPKSTVESFRSSHKKPTYVLPPDLGISSKTDPPIPQQLFQPQIPPDSFQPHLFNVNPTLSQNQLDTHISNLQSRELSPHPPVQNQLKQQIPFEVPLQAPSFQGSSGPDQSFPHQLPPVSFPNNSFSNPTNQQQPGDCTTTSESPPPLPPSFTAMANGHNYRPVYHHWFFKKGPEVKSPWIPFSMADSLNLEQEFTSNELNENTVVATDGGRYDVHIVKRSKVAVYWEQPPTDVRRCSWFVKATIDSRYIPYDENIATLLEEEFKIACSQGEWGRKVELADGEVIVINSPNSISHHQRSLSPDPWGNPPPMQQRPRVVKRGLDEFDIPEGEPMQVDHLLLLVHGIGKICDWKFRSLVEVVDDFRTISSGLIQSHYKSAVENGRVGRVEVLPVEWHRALHTEAIDQRLADITLPSIPRARQFTNETLLDVLFYTSPVFCERIVQAVGAELNRVYSLYLKRNPGYKGGVSLGGHSLGSLILFDMLCHQKPHSHLLRSPSISFEEGEESVSSLGCLKTRAKLSRKMSYLTIGSAGTGQPFIEYPQLSFQPRAFFALGSPIGMFVTVRGIESLGEEFKFPTCPSFFNIFHPNDPVAYRIEGLISKDMAKHPPILIPHHKGRKRMHLELKETMVHVTAALKQKLMDSVRSTWNTFYHMAVFHKPDQKALEHEVDKVIEDEIQSPHMAESEDGSEDSGVEMTVGQLNGGRRIDYVLQEAPLETFNQYISAIRSHAVYWESEDTLLLILKEIYGNKGITADCQVVQPILPFDLSVEANSDPGTAYAHYTTSPDRSITHSIAE